MSLEIYTLVKILHISCAIISISGFILRSLLKFKQSAYLRQRWVRTLPHIVDTVLLSCAIYLATQIHQSPWSNSWLTAKFLALLLYISMGFVVMRFAKNQQQRAAAFIIALISFSYIIAVAITHSATLGFSLN